LMRTTRTPRKVTLIKPYVQDAHDPGTSENLAILFSQLRQKSSNLLTQQRRF
jgi:hypothetical protein